MNFLINLNVILIISVSAILFVQQTECLTLDQFKLTLKIVHDTCQTKTKVDEALLQQVRDGNFVEDRIVKCYTHCFMEFMHLMEGTVGQFHVADKHTDYMIPSELFDETIKAFGHCEDATKGMTDNCEAAYTMLKCFKLDNAKFWFV